MADFSPGQKIRTASGGQLEILKRLGAGGQGTVYKVRYGGKKMALKWYFANKLHDKKKFYQRLKNNIASGAPSPVFLWPQELTEVCDGSFGYLMDLRKDDYKEFTQFLLAKEHFASIKAVINAALLITDGFSKLHSKGFSYQDLNDGNFFVNPKNGDVLICDNDNVSEYGDNSGIAGKCRYMAPEIVTNVHKPDTHTDRFSLAVILYMLFFLNHPLEGVATLRAPCLTDEAERKFYGQNPVFVWDKGDESNRPVRGVHTNEIKLWRIFPEAVREMFCKAFSKEYMTGASREDRITEREWQKMLVNLRGQTITCPSCGGETFIEPDKNEYQCINCGKALNRPLLLAKKDYRVALCPQMKLYECHTAESSTDFNAVSAECVASRKTPGVIGLTNKSKTAWLATLPNGNSKEIEPGGTVKIGRGLKIEFARGSNAEIV